MLCVGRFSRGLQPAMRKKSWCGGDMNIVRVDGIVVGLKLENDAGCFREARQK
jgi:hypothetical protein